MNDPPAEVPRAVNLRCLIQDVAPTEIQIIQEVVALTLFDFGALAISTDGRIISAGFIDEPTARAAADELSRLNPSPSSIEILAADDSWIAQQRETLGATRVGPWCLRPPWVDPPEDISPLHDIIIDPGGAFGHGGHPTTMAALALMVRNLGRGQRVLDIGTGTGVLAIVAARLGAKVEAIDTSTDAIANAQANAERNQIPAESIRFIVGDATDAKVELDDIVVANVTIDIHREIADTLRTSNKIIVSGLLGRQFRQLRSLYHSHRAATIRSIGAWVGVELTRSNEAADR